MPGGGREWTPRREYTLDGLVGLYPDTPVVELADGRDQRRDQLLLVDDAARRALAWTADRFGDAETRTAMDAHIVKVKRSYERTGEAADERRLWDHRWVRVGAVVGVLAGIATVLAVVIELAVLLSRSTH